MSEEVACFFALRGIRDGIGGIADGEATASRIANGEAEASRGVSIVIVLIEPRGFDGHPFVGQGWPSKPLGSLY